MPKWHILGWSILIPFKATEQGSDRSSLHVGVSWPLAQDLFTAFFSCSAWALQEQTHVPPPSFPGPSTASLAWHFLWHGASWRRGWIAVAHRAPESFPFSTFPILPLTSKPRWCQRRARVFSASLTVLLFCSTAIDYASSLTRVSIIFF